jgi:EAL domain-containing protein (putative c-di-GMP-specific phosphodiesterase class I)
VLDLQNGGEDALVLLRSIADLGNALGMTICAEGVETEDQLRIVRAEGCTELVSPPLPAAAMMRKYFCATGEERQAGLAG